jgi:hypothetical protein
MDDDDLDAALDEFLVRLTSGSKRDAAEGEFDFAAFEAALGATPELSKILTKVLTKQLTAEEANRLAEPHIARLIERYTEIVTAKASRSD